jgi:hypothetical protein
MARNVMRTIQPAHRSKNVTLAAARKAWRAVSAVPAGSSVRGAEIDVNEGTTKKGAAKRPLQVRRNPSPDTSG